MIKMVDNNNTTTAAATTNYQYNIDKQEYKQLICAGLGCKNKPVSKLKVRYINKTGNFCRKCMDDLLQSGLAEKVFVGVANG